MVIVLSLDGILSKSVTDCDAFVENSKSKETYYV